MKKRVGIIISILFIVIGLFLISHVIVSLKPVGQGALHVLTNIKSNVYLDNAYIGKTPLCRCNQNETIREGDYVIKIVPEDASMEAFSTRISIRAGVLTAVERTFLPASLGSAYIITLEKARRDTPQFVITSIPQAALVTIDGQPQGATPYQTKLTASEHEVEIQKEGFAKKTIKIRTVPGYKLIAHILLGTEAKEENLPSPSPTPTQEKPRTTVKIGATPQGFLRVRLDASLTSTEIGRVAPGDVLSYLDEAPGWFKVQLPDGSAGWVSASYSEKITSQ